MCCMKPAGCRQQQEPLRTGRSHPARQQAQQQQQQAAPAGAAARRRRCQPCRRSPRHGRPATCRPTYAASRVRRRRLQHRLVWREMRLTREERSQQGRWRHAQWWGQATCPPVPPLHPASRLQRTQSGGRRRRRRPTAAMREPASDIVQPKGNCCTKSRGYDVAWCKHPDSCWASWLSAGER
jgi:hypothetical protein